MARASSRRAVAQAILAACLITAPALANTYTLYAPPTLLPLSPATAGTLHFNRPAIGGASLSSTGSNVPYATNSFTAPVAGLYTFSVAPASPNFDLVSYLYHGFSTAAPLANLTFQGIAHDTPPPNADPLVFQTTLAAGEVYQLVSAGYATNPISPATNAGSYLPTGSYGGSLFQIPDLGAAAATLPITADGTAAALNSVTVRGLFHHYASDLTATLTNGTTTVTLFAAQGGSADYLAGDYRFVPAGTGGSPLPTSGTIPATGSYAGSFSSAAFAGQPLASRWTLIVADGRQNDTGSYTGFTLDLTAGAATTNVWITDADGSWTSPANWSAGTVPNAPAASATLGNLITAPRTIDLASPITVGNLQLASAIAYSLAGAGPLTFSDPSGAILAVSAGAHSATVPLAFTSALAITIAPVASLTVGTVDGTPGNAITFSGGGTLAVTARLSAANLLIPDSSLLDLRRGSALFTAAAEDDIRALVATWQATGHGLGTTATDANATLGVILNAAGDGTALYPTFAGLPASATDILVKYTYIGDTDLSGSVDAADLANLLAGLSGHLAGWQNGDTNYDGTVDATDLDNLLASLRSQGAPYADPALPPGGGVPEPAAVALLAAPVLRRHRRHQ